VRRKQGAAVYKPQNLQQRRFVNRRSLRPSANFGGASGVRYVMPF
jgi:hypothetical protein